MRDYRFVTTWCVGAPIELVFDAIDDAGRWPDWWNGVSRAELLEPGADDGVGRLWRYTWRTRLPYKLTFETGVTRARAPKGWRGCSTRRCSCDPDRLLRDGGSAPRTLARQPAVTE